MAFRLKHNAVNIPQITSNAPLLQSKDAVEQQNKYVTVQFTPEGGGDPYNIDVKSGSPYDTFAKEHGGVVGSLRQKGLTAETDPYKTGLTPEEKKKRMDALANQQRNK